MDWMTHYPTNGIDPTTPSQTPFAGVEQDQGQSGNLYNYFNVYFPSKFYSLVQ